MSALTLSELRERARERLPAAVWDFVDGGSGTEQTLRESEAAYRGVRLRPRVLVDVSAPDCSVDILGLRLPSPIAVAPMAYHRLIHPDGETATARGAGVAGHLLVTGIFASRTLEEIAGAASGPLWLQVYWLRHREALAALVERAEATGHRALVLTADAPKVARRPRDLRNSFALPPHVTAPNLAPELTGRGHRAARGQSGVEAHSREQFDPRVTWDDLAWLRERTRLPLVLKGVLTAEDARTAVDRGIDAIVVSNHGGRQLDRAVTALDALPEVVAAVPPGYPVLVDGGIRSGTDAAVALALGARAVFVGRPVLWGLACDGAQGVADVLELLRTELLEAMVLSGRPTPDRLDASALDRHVTCPHCAGHPEHREDDRRNR
jgi:4-hydroxymandelate oxidase